MVTKPSAACAAATAIISTRALRHQQRARTAKEEIGQAKLNRRQQRSTLAKAHEPATKPQDQTQAEQPPQQQSDCVDQPQPVAASQDSSSSTANQTTLCPAHSNDQPQAIDNPQPQPQRRWFGGIGNVSLPNPTVPIFKGAKSLIHFASGVPTIKPESKPPETDGNLPECNKVPLGSDLHPRDSTSIGQKSDAIWKVGTAVTAHMNGHNLPQSEYVAVLDGMLADPDTRTRLPPALVEHYDATVQGKQTTTDTLIEKLIHATTRAADVTARIMMTNQNARRDHWAGRACHRHSPSTSQTPLTTTHLAEPLDLSSPKIPGPVHGERNNCQYSNEVLDKLQDQVTKTTSPSQPLVFSDPLMEANLNCQTQINQSKGKSRQTSSLFVEECPGVMRTTKSSVRPAPYPRRASTKARSNQSLAAGVAAVSPHFNLVPEESRYAFYSASTGVAQQQPEAQQMADTMNVGIKIMHEPNTFQSDCVKKAEEAMASIERDEGPEMAAQVRIGFDLLRCYDVMKAVNGDFLSQALLDNISNGSCSQAGRPVPPPQASGSQMISINHIHPPPPQMCLHPTMGPGILTFARIFEPHDSDGQVIPNCKILLDTPICPPPAP